MRRLAASADQKVWVGHERCLQVLADDLLGDVGAFGALYSGAFGLLFCATRGFCALLDDVLDSLGDLPTGRVAQGHHHGHGVVVLGVLLCLVKACPEPLGAVA